MTATKRLLALIGLGALIAGGAITIQRHPTPAGADNKCPVGCVETDLSTPNPPGGMTFITQQTRGPWVVARPSGTSVTISVYDTTGNRPAPGRNKP